MNNLTAGSEITKLQHKINYHNYRYHVMDDPIISDYEFDQLLRKLRDLEEKYPEYATPDSPTRRVGSAPIDKFQKVSHPEIILSLANAFNKDDLIAWYERIKKVDESVENSAFVMEPKIDGLTVVLHYEDGVFVQGATRGNGEIGEDVTSNLRTIRSLPLKIPVGQSKVILPRKLVVRGEVFINIKDFENLNEKLLEKGEKTYQNPRNTASGSLRQLDPAITRERPLNLLCYAIVESSDTMISSQWLTLQLLMEAGFPVSPLSEKLPNFAAVLANMDSWIDKRDQIPFEVDGVVIKLDDLVLTKELGVAGKDPRGAVALKYPAREVTTKLLDIGVNVGRTGVLTPYAIFEPVEVGGVVVKQATLHNFDYIVEKDIRIGDKVLIKRAGDVIPYVIGPITASRTGTEKIFHIPAVCPSCGQDVENLPGEVAYYCVNTSCPAQLVRTVEHFASKGAMDIEGLGIKIVEQLVESGLVKDIADLYHLTTDELLKLEGFALRKAENLLTAIMASKKQPLTRVIISIGIRGVGEVTAQDLAKRFQSVDNLSNASFEELTSIAGIGANIALSIIDWFQRTANQNLLRKLKVAGVWPVEAKSTEETGSGVLSSYVFVITGVLPTMTREEVKELIEKNGGKTTDNVSRNTNILVAGENAGSKLAKALELGIRIIGEKELLEMTNSRS